MAIEDYGQHWVVNSEFTKDEFIKHVEQLYANKKYITFRWTVGKQRTAQQNRAMHLWLRVLVEKLNAAGLDMKKVIKKEVDIPWTLDSIKEYVWKPVQEAMYKKESSSDLNTLEMIEVAKVIDRHLQSKFGSDAHVEWPTQENKP